MLARVIASVERRSRGAVRARRTHETQLWSAVSFVSLALVLLALAWGGVLRASGPGLVGLVVLFVSEAVGQALLGLDGLRSKEPRVAYFRRTTVGRAALVSFAVTGASRYALAYEQSPHGWAILGVGGLLSALHLSSLVSARIRPDATVSVALAGSALVLGSVLLWRGHAWPAATQWAYAALLVVGVAFLDPLAAERLNLAVFSSAVACVAMR